MKNKNVIIGFAIALVILGGVVWLSRGSSSSSGKASQDLAASSVSIQEKSFDFGTVSMAAGNVSHLFRLKNTTEASIKVEKIYTSCMCTVAFLTKGSDRLGPFGMPGMSGGTPETVNASVAPGEEFEIEAVFDPAAHGPAGLGKIDRTVYIETSAGKTRAVGYAARV